MDDIKSARGLYVFSNSFASLEKVVARIKGSETEEAILLLAHPDTTAFSHGATSVQEHSPA